MKRVVNVCNIIEFILEHVSRWELFGQIVIDPRAVVFWTQIDVTNSTTTGSQWEVSILAAPTFPSIPTCLISPPSTGQSS
jgi:hypothetical protein